MPAKHIVGRPSNYQLGKDQTTVLKSDSDICKNNDGFTA